LAAIDPAAHAVVLSIAEQRNQEIIDQLNARAILHGRRDSFTKLSQ